MIIHGSGNNLIEFEGDYDGEINIGNAASALIFISDGTVLKVDYAKHEIAKWEILLVHRGSLFNIIHKCTEDELERYSDKAIFHKGVKWVYTATKWEQRN